MIAFERSQLVKEMITQLNCVNNYHKIIAIDLSKALDADPKVIQKMNLLQF